MTTQDFLTENNLDWEHFEDVECGLHSNIPSCCIIFYCVFWKPHIMTSNYLENEYWKKVNSGKFKYVPCPDCEISGKNVKIKKCECWKRNPNARLIGQDEDGLDLVEFVEDASC